MGILVTYDDIWNKVGSKIWKIMVMTALMVSSYISRSPFFQQQMCRSAKNAGFGVDCFSSWY